MENEWISVRDKLPPDDHLWYPILDSEGANTKIYGTVIRSDAKDSEEKTFRDNFVYITHWKDDGVNLSDEQTAEQHSSFEFNE